MRKKRSAPRFHSLVLKTELDIGGEKRDGFLTNLSRAGGFLAMDNPPADGTELDVWALLPWGLGELRARARVVWGNERATLDDGRATIAGVGIAFTELGSGSAELLERYLTRFAKFAAQID
jgi:hypothetical protein